MEKQLLVLHVEKGPCKGQAFDCSIKPRITIGRVVKGNSFTIRENAISQKHLCIEFNPNKWTLEDLETSNGTILNDVKLPPHQLQGLKNDDIIKIGAKTIIRVEIRSPAQELSAPSSEQNKTLKSRLARKRKADGSDEKAEVCNKVEENRSPVVPMEKNEDCGVGIHVTLGEWFCQMEEWLPKHLSAVADNIAGQIREQSQQLDAYICEKYQNNGGH